VSIDNRPRAAIALYTDGQPWYPYRECLSGPILYIREPVLPNPRCTWSRLFRGDMRVHLDLTDRDTLTEVIYLSHVDPGQVDENNLIEAIGHAMQLCGCNPRRLSGMVWDEVGDLLMFSVYPRMQDCRSAADRLLAAGAGIGVGGVV